MYLQLFLILTHYIIKKIECPHMWTPCIYWSSPIVHICGRNYHFATSKSI